MSGKLLGLPDFLYAIYKKLFSLLNPFNNHI